MGVAGLFAAAMVDSWTVVRWAGGRGLAEGAWRDPVFGHPLTFYFFDVPFYGVVLRFAMGLSLLAGMLHWLTTRGWTLRAQMPDWTNAQGTSVDLSSLELGGALRNTFSRSLIGVSSGPFGLAAPGWTGMTCCWRTTGHW